MQRNKQILNLKREKLDSIHAPTVAIDQPLYIVYCVLYITKCIQVTAIYTVSLRPKSCLIVESKELLALELLESLGVSWVSRRTSWDTEWHDGGVLILAWNSLNTSTCAKNLRPRCLGNRGAP